MSSRCIAERSLRVANVWLSRAIITQLTENNNDNILSFFFYGPLAPEIKKDILSYQSAGPVPYACHFCHMINPVLHVWTSAVEAMRVTVRVRVRDSLQCVRAEHT